MAGAEDTSGDDTNQAEPAIYFFAMVVGDWRIVGQHMWLGLDIMDVPLDSNGSLNYDEFPYAWNADDGVDEVSAIRKSII